MSHPFRRFALLCSIVVGLLVAGCAAPIPREEVPAGWALDVHQPGEWWTKPLIPRSVIVERCPPKPGWSSDPDLTRVTALPPGSDVNYSFWTDDYHCDVGWSEPTSAAPSTIDDLESETELRRTCSTTGLPMDASWRFLGHNATERVGEPLGEPEDGWTEPKGTTAGFIDRYGTVFACVLEIWNDSDASASVELSVSADLPSTSGTPVCPVTPSNISMGDDDDSLGEYTLEGAGAVRGNDGRVLTEAATLRVGLAQDSVTTSHPVVDGIAIVNAQVTPEARIDYDWDEPPPPVTGQVLDSHGKVLATCGA